jgi:hypothetical protein
VRLSFAFLALAQKRSRGLEIPSVKVEVEVEVGDCPFETSTPGTTQVAYSVDLEALASPGVSYREFYKQHLENGLVRRGKNLFPVPLP